MDAEAWVKLVVPGIIAGLVSATAVASVVIAVIQRGDKRRERDEQRDEAFRLELKQAYGRFIAAYSALIMVGLRLAIVRRRLREQRLDAKEKAITSGASAAEAELAYAAGALPKTVGDNESLSAEFNTSFIEADTRLIDVIMLDDRHSFQPSLERLHSCMLGPPNFDEAVGETVESEYRRYQTDAGVARVELVVFVRKLQGSFSPSAWEASRRESRLLAKKAAASEATTNEAPATPRLPAPPS